MIDPAAAPDVTEEQADEYGLRLVLMRPVTAAGIGAIQLHLRRTIFGEIRFSLCGIDRRAILVHIEVEKKHRRRGAGRVLVAAAAARAPRYDWTTLPIGQDPMTVAF
ncbi:hypothetical protein [Amycolatopsis sp. EV170708-02-1]|uniref:hypothetical protein n=1 Tax=Amycolatopsis sp. EV170708-02-1 TaxID=2919322 RepID=UPI001F0C27FC|nr:hypothetical protein [Amycolatopsis sp. EV170708-02-1]UMP00033.1 hypothetical protein MJQ72_26385 [Amycolatopsis sp. EV170708-02-1]